MPVAFRDPSAGIQSLGVGLWSCAQSPSQPVDLLEPWQSIVSCRRHRTQWDTVMQHTDIQAPRRSGQLPHCSLGNNIAIDEQFRQCEHWSQSKIAAVRQWHAKVEAFQLEFKTNNCFKDNPPDCQLFIEFANRWHRTVMEDSQSPAFESLHKEYAEQ